MSSNTEYINYSRDISFVAIAQVVVSLLGFIRLPILTKWLGVELYGTLSLLLVTVSLITSLAMLGLTSAIVRFLAAEKEIKTIREGFFSAAFIVLVSGIFFSLILLLCSDFLAKSVFNGTNSSYFIKLGSFMVLTQALSRITSVFFRTFRQMKWYSSLMILKGMAEIGLIISFLVLGWQLKGVIIAILLSGAISIAISLSISVGQIGFRLPKFTVLKEYLKYGLPLIPNVAILWFILFSDRYMVGYFLGTGDVGIYTAGYNLSNLILFFLSPLGMVLFPTVAKLYDAGQIAQIKTYLKYSLKYLMLVTIPAAFGLSILATPLLKILTTPEFASGAIVIPFVAFSLVFYNFYQVCLYIIRLVKKTQLEVYLLSISAILNISLNLVLIPHIGIIGAAVATLLAYGMLGISTLFISFQYLKFDLEVPFLIKSVLSSTVMIFAIRVFDPKSITQVVISIGLGVLAYFGVIFLLRGFNRKEVDLFRELVVLTLHGRKKLNLKE